MEKTNEKKVKKETTKETKKAPKKTTKKATKSTSKKTTESKDTNKKGIGKKLVKPLLVILICILGILVIYEVGIQSEGFLDTSNPMTRMEVIELLEKGKEYPNYYYSSYSPFWDTLENSKRTEIYVRNNIVRTVVDGKTSSWINYTTKESITLYKYPKNNKNYAFIGETEENNVKDAYKYSQAGFDYSLIADFEHFNYEFEYLGEKEIAGREYVLVKVWDSDSSEIFSTKFLIDKETGLIVQRSDYTMLGPILVKITCERNVRIDDVTEQNVARPDLTGYEIIDK